jgi:aspartate kinase
MGLIVQKFGGTSVADSERIRRAARRIVQAQMKGDQVVVVLSAMGHTTDRLIAMAKEITDRPSPRELDMLVSTGEQISIALMAMALQEMGRKAISFTGGQVGLITDSVHKQARIRSIDADRIRRFLAEGYIVIVAGFQGVDENANITTLGRGGSDTTAVALAAVLEADLCEIYTDVDGVYSTDPRIVPAARKLEAISYDEMLELASQGAGVMHSRSIEFGKKYKVPIHVRSSLSDNPGTVIGEETDMMERIVVSGVALKKSIAKVTIRRVPDVPGVAAKMFHRIADARIVVDDIIQSQSEKGFVDMSFTVDSDALADVKLTMEEVVRLIGARAFECDEAVAKVSAVGVGMRTHTGVATKMFQALADAKINIQMITTSEIKISVIVNEDEGERALAKVHEAFELDKAPADRSAS